MYIFPLILKILHRGGQSIESGEITDWTVRPQDPPCKSAGCFGRGGTGRDAVRYYKVAYGWKITDKEDPSMEGLHWIEAELLNMDEKSVDRNKRISE